MSKNFRSSLKHWLSKLYNHQRRPKKFVNDLANRLECEELREPKSQLEDRIVDRLMSQFEELKASNGTSEDGVELLVGFLKNSHLRMVDKTLGNIEQHIDKYFSSNQDNTRNYQDHVHNAHHPGFDQDYDCLCFQRDPPVSHELERCYRCGRLCHAGCFWRREAPEELYECPMCFLRHCIPNRSVEAVLFAGYLRQIGKDKVEYKINLPLEASVREDWRIEARCVELTTQNKHELSWPVNCMVHCNGRKMAEFKPLSYNSCIKKRLDEPIELDRRLLSQNNTIVIEERHLRVEGFRHVPPANHFIVVFAVRELSFREILAKLGRKKVSVGESKVKLKERLGSSNQEAMIGGIKVPLRCQFFRCKITTPVRSVHCNTHYHPFDLNSFIHCYSTSKFSPQHWRCPICKKRAYDLVTDEYLRLLIEANPKLDEINFNDQGETIDAEDLEVIPPSCEQQEEEEVARESNQPKLELKQQVLEEQDEINIIEDDEEKNPNPKKEYIDFVEIEDSEDQRMAQEWAPRVGKRSFDGREIHRTDFFEDEPQKKTKGSTVLPFEGSENHLSFMHWKPVSTANPKFDTPASLSRQQPQPYIPGEPRSHYSKPRNMKKEKRQHRQRRGIELGSNPDLPRQMKVLTPSPVISTVTPEAIRIRKAIPEAPKQVSRCEVLEIDSDSELDPEQLRLQRLYHHREELERERKLMVGVRNTVQISPQDERMYLELCDKFLASALS